MSNRNAALALGLMVAATMGAEEPTPQRVFVYPTGGKASPSRKRRRKAQKLARRMNRRK